MHRFVPVIEVWILFLHSCTARFFSASSFAILSIFLSSASCSAMASFHLLALYLMDSSSSTAWEGFAAATAL